jgi:hypothetical protein
MIILFFGHLVALYFDFLECFLILFFLQFCIYDIFANLLIFLKKNIVGGGTSANPQSVIEKGQDEIFNPPQLVNLPRSSPY